MKSRTRQRIRDVASGTVNWYGTTSRGAKRVMMEHMVDVVGKKKDRVTKLLPSTPMTHVVQGLRSVATISGRSTAYNVQFYSYSSYSTLRAANTSPPPVHRSKDRGDTVYVNELLAKTNPYRYEYSVPVGIKEMAELASLFEFGAKSLLGFFGGAYLNYRFGWLSFVRDIKTLSEITKSIERRIKEFKSLSSHGGLRRHVKFVDQYATGLPKTIWHIHSSYGTNVSLWATDTWKTRVSGSVRWFPTGNERFYDHDLTPLSEWNRMARIVLDLEDLDAHTMWELMPFSWLVDYFYDLSSWLGASQNSDLVSPSHICLIRKHTSARTGSLRQKPKWAKVGSHSDTLERTERSVHIGPALPTTLPVITLSEAKVITALLFRLRDSGKR